MQQLLTVPSIEQGLRDLGLNPGMHVLAHCSLSSFGHVQGGAETVLTALTNFVGGDGTLVMPTFTNGRFDPSEWSNPPVPESQWARIREETPLYHPRRTPTDHSMSVVYELFRSWPGVRRSPHPHTSMAAWGKYRDHVLADHRLEDRLGESSPLARLYDLDAYVLFLGTGYTTCTAFHLGEYRQRHPPRRTFKIVQEFADKRRLVEYVDVDTNSSVFGKLGAAFEAHADAAEPAIIRYSTIGAAQTRSFRLVDAVDFARDWLNTNSPQASKRS